MGVPKFFRWMSERYPAISQLIAENRIPEFDCLYLDMNGIIHNCTHKDSDSPTFRMTEDMMFIAIFNYIEHLFGKIKPKKLFFMAIDGVAPRAKMNQQRARRFRTALDNEKAREKAIKEGLEMPKEPPFDSNCITPGTEFMAKLTRQLKYFINKKISEDSDWQDVEVVLSGHEVPGEGEHKIMEYIRQAKAQPGYDPNVRHCLYGLDADLVMLGLLSHDPHFCLLREEVTFGRASKQKSKELEHQNFYLMHLCVVREYLELEFQSIKEPGALTFEFDIERVIDDFILMAFFVGNDFLPNLPHLHINEGALALMFETYKSILPKAGGYINQGGEISLERLALLLDELSQVEYHWFESENADASWMKSKQKLDTQETVKQTKKGKLVISSQQREIFREIKKWVNQSSGSFDRQPHNLPATLPARDREFVKTLANSLHLTWETTEDDAGQRHMRLFFPSPVEVNDDKSDNDDDDDEEAQAAIFRVLKQYDNAQIVDISPEQAQDEMERKYQQKFQDWKNNYYKDKLGWELSNEEEMRRLTENYVQGLQWVLYYYYRGVASWPWFFQHHYSPMISDVKKGLKADMTFELGQPFRPYQQLMGVLPDRSKAIVPQPYWPLMTEKDSPIIDFYPRDFELDMNGKKMDWEAVIKIPFIEEDRLLKAMATVEDQLTEEERKRNEFGVTLKFSYSHESSYTYPSSWPGVFNDIRNCRCVENIFELPTMDGLDVFVGLVPGVKLGKAALAGFPSLKVLPFVAALAFHGVTVFQQESRNQSMVVTLLDAEVESKIEQAKKKLGKVVHVGYPFLQEAKIIKVSDELFDYLLPPHPSGQPLQIPHGAHEISDWKRKAERIESVYSKRLGMEIGTVESLVHVEMLKGLRKTDKGDVIKEYALIPGVEEDYAAQIVADEVESKDQRFIERAALPLEEEFPVGSRAFFLGEMAFGRPVEVIGHAGDRLDIWVATSKGQEDNWARDVVRRGEGQNVYVRSFAVAKMLQLNPLALSKLTSALTVNSKGLRLNLGLNLKFEAKKLKVLGYSRRSESGWEFSQKAINLIQEYMVNFPEFIAGLQRNPKGDGYNDTDFYPEDVVAAKMKEIGQWLKSVEAKNFEKVPLDAEQLDSDMVKQIEAEADRHMASAGQMKTQKIRAVPRHGLLKPADAEHRLGGQKFTVGDRVVYAQDSGKVPLGLSGTVVGITRTSRTTLLDIVLDATFMSGSTLGERCSPFRGATVEALTVLNLTNRQVVADSRAANARHSTQAPTEGYYVNGYGAPTGPNGHGQLFEARVPASNPWSTHNNKSNNNAARGGATGNQRGGSGGHRNAYTSAAETQPAQAVTLPIREGSGREAPVTAATRGQQASAASRGGKQHHQNNQNHKPNRSGFTIVDRSDPTAGVVRNNPNFRPQNYSHVPPPAVLNGSANQRGRGGRGGSNSSGGGGWRGNASSGRGGRGGGGSGSGSTQVNRGNHRGNSNSSNGRGGGHAKAQSGITTSTATATARAL